MSSSDVRNLKHLSGLAEFLSNRDHALFEILNFFARVVFSDFNILRIRLMQFNEDSNSLTNVGFSGVRSEDLQILSQPMMISDKFPATDTFKSGEILCINTLPDWGSEYPLVQSSPIPKLSKTYIGVPIFVASVPVGVLSLISGDVLEPEEESLAFFNAVVAVFSMYYYRNVLSSPTEVESLDKVSNSLNNIDSVQGTELTERQLVILRLISEDRTNLSISQFLGYSESTIRQEIMKIFAKLGCSNRDDAAKLYRGFTIESEGSTKLHIA